MALVQCDSTIERSNIADEQQVEAAKKDEEAAVVTAEAALPEQTNDEIKNDTIVEKETDEQITKDEQCEQVEEIGLEVQEEPKTENDEQVEAKPEPMDTAEPAPEPKVEEKLEEVEKTEAIAEVRLETNEQQQEDGEDKDLEDGEIEDDETEEEPPPAPLPQPAAQSAASSKSSTPSSSSHHHGHHKEPPAATKAETAEKPEKGERRADRRRHSDESSKKSSKHMTEAEKSILHLRKRERLQREKWEKYRKEQQHPPPVEIPVVDDFASNLEKALASVLKKDQKKDANDEEEGAESKRGKKRKNRDKDRKSGGAKQRRIDSPDAHQSESQDSASRHAKDASKSPRSDSNFSYESDDSSLERAKHAKRASERNSRNEGRKRKRSRERNKQNNGSKNSASSQGKNAKAANPLLQQESLCLFYLQGKCSRTDCPYVHNSFVPLMKLELCKFYLHGCCAKGEKCSYMHSDFPCKFYHTGLECMNGDNCKFAHGKPLNDGMKQILFKHIETAPRELLGDFPRMSQDEVLMKITQTQQRLKERELAAMSGDDEGGHQVKQQFDAPKPKQEKRSRPSRWQDPDPIETTSQINPHLLFNANQPPPASTTSNNATPAALPSQIFPFVMQQDQDMRITSNGDIDMRTLPPQIIPNVPTSSNEIKSMGDIDIRQQTHGDIDIRQLPPVFQPPPQQDDEDDEEEMKLQIVCGDSTTTLDSNSNVDPAENKADNGENDGKFANLPKMQRDLFLRIQAQQKTNLPEGNQAPNAEEDDGLNESINWYSDDDDDDENRLTIEDENHKTEETIKSPTQTTTTAKPSIDLSKINITAEVTKLLSSISNSNKISEQQPAKPLRRDPRQAAKAEQKQSIYEQGINFDGKDEASVEIGQSVAKQRSDVDLRNLNLPFKGMVNYTPAKEIDASVNSHPALAWKVAIVDIPRPDYTGLKLNAQDAEKTGDPRLRKIFRLSTEEKDSPASPKSSPKQQSTSSSVTRIDPRLAKVKEQQQQQMLQQDPTNLTYNQQLNILQSSAFFQSLTSNQKLLLNQELAMRTEQNGGVNDQSMMTSLLSNLNLLPNATAANPAGLMGTAALNILANVNKLGSGGGVGMAAASPIVNQIGMIQPGLLGAAPGIPNMDFNAFDPRMNQQQQQQQQQQGFIQGGGGGFQDVGGFGHQQVMVQNQFDDYYGGNGGGQQDMGGNVGFGRDNNVGGGGGNRNFNRDRRRGGGNRNFNNRNSNNRNFRNRNNNRSNRSHSPT